MKEMVMPGGAPMSHASMRMSMGGLSMKVPPGGGTINILPEWLAVLWTLAFLVVLVIHLRHAAETHGERRWWHAGHVLMAIGMIFMFAPGSLDHFAIPVAFWPLLFANAAAVVVAWMLAQTLYGRPFNALWIVSAIDFAAMAYMWSPGALRAPITWLLVAYFVIQGLLWASDRYRSLDRHSVAPIVGVDADGAATIAAVQPLVCEHDLRFSMTVMSLGMAYMLAAMQLML